MNKKILCITKKVITGCLVAGALMMNVSSVGATTKQLTINKLGGKFKYTSDRRSHNHGYVKVRCDGVRPEMPYTKDGFERIRVRICRKDGEGNYRLFSVRTENEYNTYIIREGAETRKIYLNQDYLGVNTACFGWCGNSKDYGAVAEVAYDAM